MTREFLNQQMKLFTNYRGDVSRPSSVLPLVTTIVLFVAQAGQALAQDAFSHFIALTNFESFTRTTNSDGSVVWLSPPQSTAAPWNELIVSWNAEAPTGTWLKVEASVGWPDHTSKFYVMGLWTRDNIPFPRASVSHQRDADGDVRQDTLAVSHLATTVQLRLTLGGTNGVLPALSFLGLSFCNTNITPTLLPPNRAAWGKIISTPELSQHSYPAGGGWCSPTSLTMNMARWADVLKRPDWKLDVPETAAAVEDHGRFHGTGNWPFNTAFAGSRGLRAYVTRFNDLSELEDWVAAGIPVIISARWDLLQDGRPEDLAGHLTVCCGFTATGDVVINDPATNFQKGQKVRHFYKRANVQRAWATSYNTVYLVFPPGWPIPASLRGDW